MCFSDCNVRTLQALLTAQLVCRKTRRKLAAPTTAAKKLCQKMADPAEPAPRRLRARAASQR